MYQVILRAWLSLLAQGCICASKSKGLRAYDSFGFAC
jgi:hypothetical protein